MKKIPILTILMMLFEGGMAQAGTCWNRGFEGASPWHVLNGPGGAPSGELIDVDYCVNTVANPGDTVIIPSGSWRWASGLIISDSINLQGQTTGCPDACDDGTVILGGDSNHIITISVEGDKVINISGLTLDGESTITNKDMLCERSEPQHIRLLDEPGLKG